MLMLLPVAWVLLSPFGFAALITGLPSVNHRVARHLPLVLAVGWTGVALVIAGAFLVGGPTGRVLLLAGAPLSGLSFWTRGGGDDGGDGRDDGPEPVDWDRFLDDVDRWRRERERDRIPSR